MELQDLKIGQEVEATIKGTIVEITANGRVEIKTGAFMSSRVDIGMIKVPIPKPEPIPKGFRHYSIIVKSHCEAPDWEADCYATDIDEAIAIFRREGGLDYFNRKELINKIFVEELCKICQGTGEVDNTCTECKGRGWEEVEEC